WLGGFEPFGRDHQQGGAQDSLAKGIFLRMPGQWDDPLFNGATLGDDVYYNVHRWYESQTGRYARPDPLGLRAGVNVFQYAKASPVRYVDALGLEVQVCCAPANILWGLVDHCWIKTDTVEAGTGADPGNSCNGPFSPMEIADHSGASETRPGAQCHPVPGVDEPCVNKALQIGASAGRFSPTNTCQSFAAGVIRDCRICRDPPQLPPEEYPPCAGFGCLQSR
ncbi:MAG: RHS repeat-associated core domain-containing protein, partial [Thermoanaerobaculia bacterium]|nr:RHS repeat-associated core domain-containing protein [Thermoanaerobaculia bacterium]